MAFRKRSKFRKRPFRAKLARRRKTWQQFNIDPCNPVILEHCVPEDGCCTDKAALELLGNQQLQDLYSDRASVVRVLGDLWFCPNMGTITAPIDIREWLGWLGDAEHFLGLRRGEITSQQPTMPLADIWDNAFDDLSEAQWMKTWQHLDRALNNFEYNDATTLASTFGWQFPVSQADTHTFVVPGTTGCNNFASGTGNICIETTDVGEFECVSCDQGFDQGAINFTGVKLAAPRMWHVHLDVKKRIPLRENQGLYLVYNLRHYSAAPPPAEDSFTSIFGNVRTLIEMG